MKLFTVTILSLCFALLLLNMAMKTAQKFAQNYQVKLTLIDHINQ